jgi:hypothetical protein
MFLEKGKEKEIDIRQLCMSVWFWIVWLLCFSMFLVDLFASTFLFPLSSVGVVHSYDVMKLVSARMTDDPMFGLGVKVSED